MANPDVNGERTPVPVSISDFAGLATSEIDARLSIADVAHLTDQLCERLRTDLAAATFGFPTMLLRVVVIERTTIEERDLRYAGGSWAVSQSGSAMPGLVFRWQGVAEAIRCANGDSRVQTAVMSRMCEIEGSLEARHAVSLGLAEASDDPMDRVFALRGLPDRQLERRLRSFDVAGLLRELAKTAASAFRVVGTDLGRTLVVQVEVPTRRAHHVVQVLTEGSTATVLDQPDREPTIVVRFSNALDLVRVCTEEVTPMELVVGGAIAVDGDLSLFANLDLLRW